MTAEGTRLAGRTALVTGASRGIGRRVAEVFADEGARVWGLARSEPLRREVSASHGVIPLVADLADDASTWGVIDEMQDSLGAVPDLVVNAAGVFGIAPVAETTLASFDTNHAVNVRGTFIVVRAVLPGMLERGTGMIINIGSVAGRKAFPGNAAYSASKYGLRGFHEVLAEEVRGSGVRASLVEPAATDTELWDPLDPDSDPGLPDRSDMLSVDDVAQAVLFVATRPTGVTIPVLQVERG